MKIKKELKTVRRNQIMMIILLMGILVATLIHPAQAQTITFTNPNSETERDILVYFPNQTLQGTYNTTSVIDLNSSIDYIFVIKPQYTNPLDDPLGYLTNLVAWAETNAVALFFLACIIGIALVRIRR